MQAILARIELILKVPNLSVVIDATIVMEMIDFLLKSARHSFKNQMMHRSKQLFSSTAQ